MTSQGSSPRPYIATIEVRVETHYGRETIYPVCPKARAFAKIAGTKTLTPRAIKAIKALGYRVVNIYA